MLTESSEMRMYKSVIRAVASYGCDTWALKDVVCKHSELWKESNEQDIQHYNKSRLEMENKN